MKTFKSHLTTQRSNTGFACVALTVFFLGFGVFFSALAKADEASSFSGPVAADSAAASTVAYPNHR